MTTTEQRCTADSGECAERWLTQRRGWTCGWPRERHDEESVDHLYVPRPCGAALTVEVLTQRDEHSGLPATRTVCERGHVQEVTP